MSGATLELDFEPHEPFVRRHHRQAGRLAYDGCVRTDTGLDQGGHAEAGMLLVTRERYDEPAGNLTS